jgi:hypothetical protein
MTFSDRKELPKMISMKLPAATVCLLAVVLLSVTAAMTVSTAAAQYQIPETHPRIFINKASLKALAARCSGPLHDDYIQVKRAADTAVSRGNVK